MALQHSLFSVVVTPASKSMDMVGWSETFCTQQSLYIFDAAVSNIFKKIPVYSWILNFHTQHSISPNFPDPCSSFFMRFRVRLSQSINFGESTS